jgi:hypothetical protein
MRDRQGGEPTEELTRRSDHRLQVRDFRSARLDFHQLRDDGQVGTAALDPAEKRRVGADSTRGLGEERLGPRVGSAGGPEAPALDLNDRPVLRQAETEDLGDAFAHPLLFALEHAVEGRDHDDSQLDWARPPATASTNRPATAARIQDREPGRCITEPPSSGDPDGRA